MRPSALRSYRFCMDIPIIAGTVSTVVFAVSNLPMLRKALRTRDVSSYSLSSLVMINAANVVYSLYVFTLPIGPIWALHTFYLVSCAIMVVLCLRQRRTATPKVVRFSSCAASHPCGTCRGSVASQGPAPRRERHARNARESSRNRRAHRARPVRRCVVGGADRARERSRRAGLVRPVRLFGRRASTTRSRGCARPPIGPSR